MASSAGLLSLPELQQRKDKRKNAFSGFSGEGINCSFGGQFFEVDAVLEEELEDELFVVELLLELLLDEEVLPPVSVSASSFADS